MYVSMSVSISLLKNNTENDILQGKRLTRKRNQEKIYTKRHIRINYPAFTVRKYSCPHILFVLGFFFYFCAHIQNDANKPIHI
jgi:hypothetical protein